MSREYGFESTTLSDSVSIFCRGFAESLMARASHIVSPKVSETAIDSLLRTAAAALPTLKFLLLHPPLQRFCCVGLLRAVNTCSDETAARSTSLLRPRRLRSSSCCSCNRLDSTSRLRAIEYPRAD